MVQNRIIHNFSHYQIFVKMYQCCEKWRQSHERQENTGLLTKLWHFPEFFANTLRTFGDRSMEMGTKL